MPRYVVRLTDSFPAYCNTTVEVEAADKGEAEDRAREMVDADEVDWSYPEHDYDAAEIVGVEVTEL